MYQAYVSVLCVHLLHFTWQYTSLISSRAIVIIVTLLAYHCCVVVVVVVVTIIIIPCSLAAARTKQEYSSQASIPSNQHLHFFHPPFSLSVLFVNPSMGGGRWFYYPTHVWTPAGGWFKVVPHWQRNTAVALGVLSLCLFGTFQVSASLEVRAIRSWKSCSFFFTCTSAPKSTQSPW